ncbi:MAG: Ca-activated chloride channel family protein [Myxococcota bacterium]|jgi:Ca-activated chloride channel family protein
MTLARLGLFALLASSIAAQASATDCGEILALHATGLSATVIADLLRADGVADPEGEVARCLAQATIPEAEEPAEEDERQSAGEAMDIGDMVVTRGSRRAEPAAEPVSASPRQQHAPARKSASARADSSGSAAMARPRPMSPPPPAAMPVPVERELASNTEQYTDYGVNELVLTEHDAQSTFAVDVDTASYTIARSKLDAGRIPEQAAVRVEEFVNYLPYDYASPRWDASAPFAVHLEAAPSPFTPNRHVLRVGVKGRESSPDRRPAHLTFLVDTSCSMSSADKLGLAQEALHTLVDNLGIEDTVALATYAGSTSKVLDPTPVTRKGAIHAAIDRLASSGGTAMASGMDLAYDMADAAYLPGGINRVIVLSDGDANIGPASHDQILSNIRQYADKGITMTTIGLGSGNYKDTMMEQLANKGDGNYFYIDSIREADRVFGSHIGGTLDLIARDVKIQVEFDPDAVRAYRLIGYENRDIADQDFRNDKVDAGEIGAGHAVTALYEVVLRDGADAADLATVRIRAKRPGPDVPAREWHTGFERDAMAPTFASSHPDLQVAFAAATFAELLRGSPHVSEVSYADVEALLRSAERTHDEDADLLRMVQTAGQLSGESLHLTAAR